MNAHNTIGSLIDHGYGLNAYCYNTACRHHAELRLIELARKLGRGHSSMHNDLAPKLVCTKCRGRSAGLRLRAPRT